MMERLIHKGFFKEMFRQLAVAGIVSGGILMLVNLTSVFSIITSGVAATIPSGEDMASSMKTFVIVMGFVFPFVGFAWLNKRYRSDFYHGIPVTRTQMYFTTVLVMLIWMAIGLTAYALVNALMHLAFGAPFNYLLFLCVYINMLIASVEVIGGVSLACALSGTRFVNFIAALVIVFMPRLLLTTLMVFTQIVSPTSIMANTICFLFDPTYNIIASPFLSLFKLILGVTADYGNVIAMIYTFVYSVILVILGWIAFKKRKSETAGNPAAFRFVQPVIRICIGLPLLLVVVGIMLLVGDLFSAAIYAPVLIVLAFVFYCLYELISTKSALKMAKSMPLFLVCAAIAVGFYFLPKLISGHELSIKISAESMEGYSLYKNSEDIGIFEGMSTEDHAALASRKVLFTDEESKAIIAAAYARQGGEDFYSSETIPITIHRGFARSITRNLTFTQAEMSKLNSLMLKNEEYSKAQTDFPKGVRYYYCGDLDRSRAKELGETLEEEFASLTAEQRRGLLSNGQLAGIFDELLNDSGSDLTIRICGCLGTENYVSNVRIDRELTPKTYKRYLELNNEMFGQKVMNCLDELEAWTINGGRNTTFTISIDGDKYAYINYWMFDYFDSDYGLSFLFGEGSNDSNDGKKPVETDPEYCEIIEILSRAELTDDIEDHMIVTVSMSKGTGLSGILYGGSNSSSGGTAAMKLSEEDMARLDTLLKRMDLYEQYYDFDIDLLGI